MSDLKQLIEKATQKSEMRWRVHAFDPAQDNKLVHTSDDFDCIECAMKYKREYLEKCPNCTVEISSSRINEAIVDYKGYLITFSNKTKACHIMRGNEISEVIAKSSNAAEPVMIKAAKAIIDKGNVDLSKKFIYESEQEFDIKSVTPFGKTKICSWKAGSKEDAVKEFLAANVEYQNDKKGKIIAEGFNSFSQAGRELKAARKAVQNMIDDVKAEEKHQKDSIAKADRQDMKTMHQNMMKRCQNVIEDGKKALEGIDSLLDLLREWEVG